VFDSLWFYLEPLLGFALLVGIGLVLRATKVVKSEASQPLNNIITYVALPAFVFNAIYGAEFTFDLLKVVATGWIILPVLLLLAWLLSRLLKLSKALTGATMLCVAFANSGYIGYPLTLAIFGANAMPTSVFYDIFVTVISLVLVGIPLAAYYGSSGGRRFNPLLELLRMPAVWGLVLAVVLRGFVLPEVLANVIDMLAATTAPLIMLSVGLSLSPRKVVGNLRLILGIGIIRLLIAPLLAFVVSLLLLGSGLTQQIVTFEASMPVVMLGLVLSQRYKLDTPFVATMIFISICLSAITLPALQLLLF
jgi:predicted permease